MSARVWSAHQERIFSFVQSGKGNAVVQAVAGSGKTTTIVEALSRVQGTSIFLAFNKAIAEELKKRGVNARTFHSLCYGPVTRARGCNTVNTNKLWELIEANLGDSDVEMYGPFLTRLVGLGRQAGIGCLVPDLPESWLELVEQHDLEPDHELATVARGVELASKLLTSSNAAPAVDFDDLLYLAVKDGISLPKFDFVFVDEAQDTNAIQRALLRKIMKAEARMVAVGDPGQAIYGFRGADSESLNMIADEFNCVKLPLTVSYRCPQTVVHHARQWVPDIQFHDAAPLGAVHSLGAEWNGKTFVPNDLVVCRTTKPLVALAYRLIGERVPVYIMGREIGQGLTKLVTRMKARTIEVLIERLNEFTNREFEKAIAKKNEAKAAAIQDKSDTILVLIEGLFENDRTVAALLRVIEDLFSNKANAVVLATIHKAKGLEAQRVFWLNSSQCPAKWAKKDWQVQQEHNLCYVATTRAMSELFLIEFTTNGRK